MESCVLHFQVPLIIAVLQLVTILLGFSSSESELSLVYISIHWLELQGDFYFQIEVKLCSTVEYWKCHVSLPPSLRRARGSGTECSGQPVATVRSPAKPALASGSCDIRVAFAAFTWSPSLCVCACNYQRHTQCMGSVNPGVSKYLSTTVSFLQLL